MTIPDTARRALSRRLNQHRQHRWPQLEELAIRYRGGFAYITGITNDEKLQLCRLRYLRSADQWGFAIYLASRNSYEDSVLPTGSFTGTPEQALDCACGLYLNDPTAWIETTDIDSPNNI
jgi:hypothetical protein